MTTEPGLYRAPVPRSKPPNYVWSLSNEPCQRSDSKRVLISQRQSALVIESTACGPRHFDSVWLPRIPVTGWLRHLLVLIAIGFNVNDSFHDRVETCPITSFDFFVIKNRM